MILAFFNSDNFNSVFFKKMWSVKVLESGGIGAIAFK